MRSGRFAHEPLFQALDALLDLAGLACSTTADDDDLNVLAGRASGLDDEVAALLPLGDDFLAGGLHQRIRPPFGLYGGVAGLGGCRVFGCGCAGVAAAGVAIGFAVVHCSANAIELAAPASPKVHAAQDAAAESGAAVGRVVGRSGRQGHVHSLGKYVQSLDREGLGTSFRWPTRWSRLWVLSRSDRLR